MHLKVGYRPWAGDHQVAAEDAGAIAISHYEIDDIYVPVSRASLDLEGFMMLTIRQPDLVTPDEYPKLMDWWHALREKFSDPEFVVEGTDDETLILLVSSIEFVEMPAYAIA